MKPFFLLFSLLLLVFPLFAQKKSVLDSLQKVYRSAQTDTTKILVLLEKARQYSSTKPDSCIALAQQALRQSEKINFLEGKSLALNNLGIGYRAKADYPLALAYHQKALKIRESMQDRQGIARSQNNIAIIYKAQNNYAKALEYHQKSLKIKESIGDRAGIAVSLNNIAIIYMDQNHLSLSLEYHQKSLQIKETLNDQRGISSSLNNIADIYLLQDSLDAALTCYNRSLKIKEEIKDRLNMVNSLDGLAKVYQKQRKYEASIDYSLRALAITQESKAIVGLEKASKTLYETYKLKGDYIKALEYHELYSQTRDSSFNIEKSKSIANLENQMLLEKKDKELILFTKNSELSKLNSQQQAKDLEIAIKQAETEHLFALALQETNKRKQDSLESLAEKTKLATDKLRIEGKAQTLEVLKEKEGRELQQRINYLILLSLFSVIFFAYYIYRSRQKERGANERLNRQKQEIETQAEELQNTLLALQKTQVQLVQSEKSAILGIVMATISHEINNPMNSVKVGLQVLKENLQTLIGFLKQTNPTLTAELQKLYQDLYLDDMAEDMDLLTTDMEIGANRVMEIVQNLQTFIRLDEKGKKQVNISKNFEAVLVILRSRFLGRIEIETDFEDNLPFIDCDISKINQVFLALLLNAAESIEEKGKIKVCSFQNEDFVVFSVADNGRGIPEEIQPYVFDAFVSTKDLSSGVGLYIVKEIIEEHKGKIEIQTSKTGTTLRIFLPKH